MGEIQKKEKKYDDFARHLLPSSIPNSFIRSIKTVAETYQLELGVAKDLFLLCGLGPIRLDETFGCRHV
jgi:hypothetical protein